MSSAGLKYTLSGKTYVLSSIGTCKDTNIVIPAKHPDNGKAITSIGKEAFKGCTFIENISFEDDSELTSVGTYAFTDCSSLKSITIPKSVKTFNNYAFKGCTSLDEIKYKGTVSEWAAKISFYNPQASPFCNRDPKKNKIEPRLYEFDESISDYIEVTEINEHNFTASKISGYAFYKCYSLTSVTIPNCVTNIGRSAFSGCELLENVKIDGAPTVSEGIFSCCYNLKFVTINKGLTTISNSMFSDCHNLPTINIPDSVTSIGSEAFKNCYIDLTTITIPDSVTSIGNRAFYGCGALIGISFGKTSELTSIGVQAFYNCDSLTSITIPDNVTSIGDDAFSGCISLTHTSETGSGVSRNLKYIGTSSNPYLYLVGVILSQTNHITSAQIHYKCRYINSQTFNNCSLLANIYVDEDNTNYKSIDGNLYSIDGTTLITYARGKKTTSFRIPNTVEKINNFAFCNCINLASITVPDSVTSIGESAFSGCKSLISLIIPDSVTGISTNTFIKCISLENIVIGSGIVSIDKDAFKECGLLTNMVLLGDTPPTLSATLPNNIKLYCYPENSNSYKTATNWQDYSDNFIGDTLKVTFAINAAVQKKLFESKKSFNARMQRLDAQLASLESTR